MRIDRTDPTAPPAGIGPGLSKALFAAVLVHDTIDLDAALPDHVDLDFGPDRFARFFALARATWADGVDRRTLARIAGTALAGRPLGNDDAAAFKDIRARFKQLRFAYVMFDRGHRYPARLDHMTRRMGHLQDALRHGRPVRALRQALALRLLATRLPFAAMVSSLDRFRPSDPASFRAYLDCEMAAVRDALAPAPITAKRFHETRKIVSRLVAMFDCVDTIEPSPEHHATVRYLSTINGLMGGMHDDMVAHRFAGSLDYHAGRFVLPEPVATRLRRLEQVFGAAR